MGGGKGGSKKTVVGYEYYMAAIFGLCMKADRILKIVYGDRVAWEGSASDQEIFIDKFNLFGGNEVGGSGGLKGYFIVSTGKKTQMPNRIMTKYLGPDVYAHRNMLTLSMDKSYVAAFSPQFKIMKVLCQNLSYDWYVNKSIIYGSQINPIHEIRDVLINPDLGGQYTASDLDESSFIYAADVLYSENFGLSPIWSDSDSINSYIQKLLNIIDGIKVKDRATGKIKIKLLRNDYNIADLITIGPESFTAISTMTMVTLDSMVNRVTIKFTKITDVGEEASSITQENMANVDLQGGRVNSVELDYSAITNAIPDLAPRVLSRELRNRSYPLRSFTITGRSALSQFSEGDLFILTFPERGITSLVARVMEADYGTVDSPTVTLSCTEDIFSVAVTNITASTPPTEWEDPFSAPIVPTIYNLYEMPYYLLINEGVGSSTDLANANQALGYMMTLAQKPQSTAYSYLHKYRDQNGWQDAGLGSFSVSVILSADILENSAVISIGNTSGYTLNIGDLAFIDDEIIKIIGWDTKNITVSRGMLDTLPKKHTKGARIWLPSNEGGGIYWRQYLSGETASCVLATTGPLGTVDPSGASSVSLKMTGRMRRPYPPAYLRVNDLYFPAEFEGEATFSWRHRDRLLQDSVLVDQSGANIGPEEGTTYNLNLYDENGTLRKSLTGLTDTSYKWDTEIEDSGLSVISMKGISNTSYATGTSKTEIVPACNAGDTILVWVMHQSNIVSFPADYTLEETETCNDGSSTYNISLYSKIAVSSNSGSSLIFSQESSGNISVNINIWNFSAGLVIRGIAKVSQNNVNSKTILWPTITAQNDNITAVVGGVSTYANSSYTEWTTSSGVIVSTKKMSNNRMCIGYVNMSFGSVLSGTYSFDDAARNHGSAAIAILLGAPDGSAVDLLNRSITAELWSTRGGIESRQRWNVNFKRKTPSGFGNDFGNNFGGA